MYTPAAGEQERGACQLNIDKRTDYTENECQTYFGDKVADKTLRGSSESTLVLERWSCDHGPQDNRLQKGPLAEKGQRSCAKAMGLSHKARPASLVTSMTYAGCECKCCFRVACSHRNGAIHALCRWAAEPTSPSSSTCEVT